MRVIGRRWSNDANICFANGFVAFVQGDRVEAVRWRMEDQLAFVQETLAETVFFVVGMNSSEKEQILKLKKM